MRAVYGGFGLIRCTMQVRVLLFGPQAAGAKADAVRVSVETDATPEAVMAALARACPELGPSLASSRLAVNGVFADPATRIGETDELALIGLVSGG